MRNLALAIACSLGFSPAYGADTTIGFMDELTLKDGKTPSWGAFVLKGLKLAISERPDLRIEVIERNVSRSPVEAGAAASELLKENVDLIFGLREDGQALMAKRVIDGRVPFVTPMASSDELLTGRGTTVSFALRNSHQVEAIISHLLAIQTPPKQVSMIVTLNCVYCTGMAQLLEQGLAKHGIGVARFVDVIHGKPIKAASLKPATEYAHIVMLTDESEGLSIIRFLRDFGFRGMLIGGDSWPVPYLGLAETGPELKTMCLVNSLSFDPDDSHAKKTFRARYEQRYAEHANDMAGLAYDAGRAVVQAIAACKPAKAAELRACLGRKLLTVTMDGASGTLRIEPSGGRASPASLLRTFGACNGSKP